MTEFLQQFQGFDWWSPAWDAIFIMGSGVIATVILIVLGSFGKTQR